MGLAAFEREETLDGFKFEGSVKCVNKDRQVGVNINQTEKNV